MSENVGWSLSDFMDMDYPEFLLWLETIIEVKEEDKRYMDRETAKHNRS